MSVLDISEPTEITGYHDCECCGIAVIGERLCGPCEAGHCEWSPETWHCVCERACDGTACDTYGL